ncbi:DUF3800 domain-containing protein [Sporolactobacillus shoreae]|uniref:DUF3800 domain-containing protein n=1 Tax=Sporolactobacillus shoreae TaxID=1465501 RepID=A0A4Z0GN75_9BACL|nr:DUF3800 domain-containing protein [Sporolactobacillus shoreae]TGA98010.1 DUF3800 domain-containing protein [Sporolactobacillus shoreae]
MVYSIYFDESGKIDQPDKLFSYYGAYGSDDTSMKRINQTVKNIFADLGTQSELHFTEYKHDQYLKKYLTVLNYVINQDVTINILIVDNHDAKRVSDQMQIKINELRSLLYVKIPERLFYGLTRRIESDRDIRIVVDRNDEYRKLRLYSKVKEQMNAHSAYRNNGYTVNDVHSEESCNSIPLQIIDTFIGIIAFVIEKNYYSDSDSAKIKSDLIYRFLIQEDNLVHFQNQITLFEWKGNEDLDKIPVSRFISEFVLFKTSFDLNEMARINRIRNFKPDIQLKALRREMGYPNTRRNMILGYLDQLRGFSRNSFLNN